ncbi:hypothetical protein D9756_002155 [Leucocoprinus leucothites]|uniref:F-box domain-containing protein n=1 Tax=Leucocoprinus leucothites TaxID=201217 RepID=A0A8H5GC13_9AGAR|nr:hypothetical protein D9756_002155 [Leucoagaricus leucothites]
MTKSYYQDEVDPLISSFDSPEAELSYLSGLAAATSARITRSTQLLARIQRRYNQLQSPIHTLPFEILSSIFHIICPSDCEQRDVEESDRRWEVFREVNFSAIMLSSVSWHWRQVALATPKLWTSITLRMKSGKIRHHALLLQHYMARAKPLDISLDLLFSDFRGGTGFDLEYSRIYSILFAQGNAERIGVLRLYNPPLEWLSMVPMVSPLHTLCVEFPFDRPSDRSGAHLDLHFHSLRRLFLGGSNWALAHVPQSLKFLTLSRTPPEFDIHVLQQALELVECHSDNPTEFQNVPDLLFDIPLVFNNLSSFTWSVGKGINGGSAAQNLYLPALKKLCLIAPEPVEGQPIIDFIHKHAKTLHSLELNRFIEWSREEYFVLLFRYEMPCLHTVAVTSVILSGLVTCILALTPKEDELDEGSIPLPNLRFLRLEDDGNERYDEEMPQFGELVLNMLRVRRAGEHSEFHLDITDFEDDEDDIWPDYVQDGLTKYLANHQVKITQKERIPSWLESA